MAPLDRLHTNSYLFFIVTMVISCTGIVFIFLQRVCLSVCVTVCLCAYQLTKSGSGDMSCSVDRHISGCEYFGRCLYVFTFVCFAESAKSR